nr:L-selectin-like [Misgurnus anguillicaudatus]
MELMFHMLYFSGLCLVTLSIQYQYVLIQQMKTWNEAQAYCRQNYIDLATVQTNEDWINIQDAVQVAMTGVTWIGLYNNINSWRWSYKQENMTVQYWAVREPNNYNTREECVVIDNGTWIDHPCTHSHPFICSNAQSYCRQHYTDLATIRNETENDELGLMTEIIPAWIGLYRDSWKWWGGEMGWRRERKVEFQVERGLDESSLAGQLTLVKFYAAVHPIA